MKSKNHSQGGNGNPIRENVGSRVDIHPRSISAGSNPAPDTNNQGCGKQELNYEAHNETGELVPCEVLICGKRNWFCDKCKKKNRRVENER